MLVYNRLEENMIIHTVSSGETVNSIARMYGVPPSRIIQDNELALPGQLTVGQTLVITQPTATYTVKNGDSLYSIATDFGVSVDQLLRNNPILGGNYDIYPGQTLVISYPPPQLGRHYVNAYIYPFVDRDVLRKTLPYLSYLTIFTYGIRRDGTLIPPESGNDEEIIATAQQYGVAPIMLVSTLTEEGVFSNELADYIFTNPEIEDIVVQNIVDTAIAKGYAGVDLDFEYIGAANAENFVEFATKVRDALKSRGNYELFISLAPKNQRDMPGLLYEGHNYGELGNVADKSLLMTYEWGYAYGPPMAIAPLDAVARVVDYAQSETPSEKLMLGMPNYAYDWQLPYIGGTTVAEALTNVEAIEQAQTYQVPINFDEAAQSPFYRYFERGVPAGQEAPAHIVWFEDARSIQAKLELAAEDNLAGVSVWNIMNYYAPLWLVVNSMYDIIKPGVEQ
jgi:spore germination protein